MTLPINADRHYETVINGLSDALHSIESLYENNECLREIIDIAVDWYENDNILYYSFFNEAFPCSRKDPAGFYGSLGSFLVNTLLDDSYFEIKWTRYSNGDYVKGTPFVDQPSVTWSKDDNGLSDWKKMLDVMKFAIEQDRKLTERFRVLEDLTMKRL